MAKHLKLFETHSEYVAFTQTEDFLLPNVSHCVSENDVHYNPIVAETRILVTYNITNASDNDMQIYGYNNNNEFDNIRAVDTFDKIEIDGVEISTSVLDAAQGKYELSVGEHIIAYTLSDETTIPEGCFGFCYTITSIAIPIGVTTIENQAFYQCYGLENVTIPNTVQTFGNFVFGDDVSIETITFPNSVIEIGYDIFNNCQRLVSFIIEATTPPTLGEGAFFDCASGIKIYVPSESVNTYKAANGWSDYASIIEAIPTI